MYHFIMRNWGLNFEQVTIHVRVKTEIKQVIVGHSKQRDFY